MVELADIFRHAGPAYRQAFAGRIPPSHLRAMEDIVRCRTPALGGSLYACDDCGALDYAYHSCRNRHCPKCQEDRAQSWLERLRSRLLPCHHYLLTFTLPAPLRTLARSHQRVVYAILLREAAAAVQSLADDPTWVGGRLAILALLHTWSRTLAYHPHAHLLVTAGGLSPDGTAWIQPAHPRFLVPGYMLSEVFRAKVHAALAQAGLDRQVDPDVWTTRWTVHVQQIGTGQHAALYLSRYIYRVALTNHRIERFEHGRVTFRYTHARTHETRRMILPAHHFIGRFLQHVLPRRFAKVRYFGLLSPTSRQDLQRARYLLESARPPLNAAQANAPPSPSNSSAPPPPNTTPSAHTPALRRCSACERGHLRLLSTWYKSRAPP